MAEKPVVHVVDDDSSVCESLERLLRLHNFDVRLYRSAGEFLINWSGDVPGCVLLDIRMPGPSGLDLQQALSRREDGPPVVFLSGLGDVPMSVLAMRRGAVDFLTKPIHSGSLLAAVNAAVQRDLERRERDRAQRAMRDRFETLNVRERQVLAQVVDGRLNKQIAESLGTCERTVKAHRAHVMEKLGVSSLAELVHHACSTLPRGPSGPATVPGCVAPPPAYADIGAAAARPDDGAGAPPSGAGAGALADRARATVMLVDDDAQARAAIGRQLRSAGWNVQSFASALEFLAAGPFAGLGCVVLDIRMPGMTGPELQQCLRDQDSTLPVIFLSGRCDVPTSVTAMRQGAVSVLEKPADDAEFLQAVADAVERHRQALHVRRAYTEIAQRLARLTPRERQVLTQVSRGRLNKQVASDLGIAVKTVKVHRGRAMEKMGVKTVTALVQLCGPLGA